jgi:orotidine-5'-phosphate decarboxylase
VVVVGDAKRGDVAATAEAYARALFEVWDFDVVTLSPYLGRDSVEPFLRDDGRGAFVLCRTSNPGARDLQDLRVDGTPLYRVVADRVASWDPSGRLGLVTGATYPEELAEIRAAHPSLPLLIPGVGAQGGDLEKCARAARGRMLISSSRAVLYASADPARFADAARSATESLRTAINEALRG